MRFHVGWLCWNHIMYAYIGAIATATRVHIYTQTLGFSEIFQWNLIYVLRTCIAVAAIWCDFGSRLCWLWASLRTELSSITLHTKPLDECARCVPNEIRCNAAYAFSLHQKQHTAKNIYTADGALHPAFSNYLFIIWYGAPRSRFAYLAGKLFLFFVLFSSSISLFLHL